MCVCVCIFVRTVAATLAENVIYDGRPIVCSFILCYVYTNHIKRWWMSVFRIAPVTFWCITGENCRCIILSTDSVKYTCHGCVSVAGCRTGSNKWSQFRILVGFQILMWWIALQLDVNSVKTWWKLIQPRFNLHRYQN